MSCMAIYIYVRKNGQHRDETLDFIINRMYIVYQIYIMCYLESRPTQVRLINKYFFLLLLILRRI